MTVATDPKTDTLQDSDDEFAKAFDEFAAAKTGQAPNPEEPNELDEPGGNGPDEKDLAPAEEDDKSDAAAEESSEDEATPGDAKPEGGSQPPEGEKAPDLWANAPEELKAEFLKVQQERDEAKHKASSDANRVAALTRKLQTLQTAPASAPAPAEPSEAQVALDAKVKQLREDYGEIAEPLIEMIEAQKQELSTVRTVLTGLSQERQAQVIAQETQALEERHPDWRDIAASTDFEGWLQVQPENIQRLATSWDARETSVVLTLFKAERAETTGQKAEAPETEEKPKPNAATGARRSQQLDGGRDVGSRPAPAASDAPEDFDAAFEHFSKKRQLKEQAQLRAKL